MVAGGRGELQLEERVENLFYCTADKIFFHQDGSFSFNLGFSKNISEYLSFRESDDYHCDWNLIQLHERCKPGLNLVVKM